MPLASLDLLWGFYHSNVFIHGFEPVTIPSPLTKYASREHILFQVFLLCWRSGDRNVDFATFRLSSELAGLLVTSQYEHLINSENGFFSFVQFLSCIKRCQHFNAVIPVNTSFC